MTTNSSRQLLAHTGVRETHSLMLKLSIKCNPMTTETMIPNIVMHTANFRLLGQWSYYKKRLNPTDDKLMDKRHC